MILPKFVVEISCAVSVGNQLPRLGCVTSCQKSRLRSPCYVVTFVKRESAIYIITILFFREHLKRVLEKQSSALATLLFVDWLPQVNGPPKSPVSLKS